MKNTEKNWEHYVYSEKVIIEKECDIKTTLSEAELVAILEERGYIIDDNEVIFFGEWGYGDENIAEPTEKIPTVSVHTRNNKRIWDNRVKAEVVDAEGQSTDSKVKAFERCVDNKI